MSSRLRADAERLLPLKPLVFEILLALAEGPRHGWTIVRALQARLPRARILPGHFYRTLARTLDVGLVEPAPRKAGAGGADERRRYFRLTALGEAAASAEARRLELLVAESRARRLLSSRSRS
jgi:DNA-binding PadR family transcriptional regulator